MTQFDQPAYSRRGREHRDSLIVETSGTAPRVKA
jgi:hypothetical protein